MKNAPLPLLRALRTAMAMLLFALTCAGLAAAADAAEARTDPQLPPALLLQVRQLVLDKAAVPVGSRVEVRIGRLDPRLKLPLCERVEPFLPLGNRLSGHSRVGLRCASGPSKWNVYLPVSVQRFGPGLVAATDLPAGHVLREADVRVAEVELTELRADTAWTDAASLTGRTLAGPLTAGQPLRQQGLKPRQWFAPGDRVQVRVAGSGFAVMGAGEALSAGMEGQTVRVRTESGKVISGRPVAERQIEVSL